MYEPYSPNTNEKKVERPASIHDTVPIHDRSPYLNNFN